MRGAFVDQGGLFSYIAPEARVPANHPLRKIRVDQHNTGSPVYERIECVIVERAAQSVPNDTRGSLKPRPRKM
jgi:hypothetical protein